MREGTTSRVMVANRPYGEFYDFTASVQNILDTTTYSSVKIFNQLPQNILKHCNNIRSFKTLLRACLVKNAFYCVGEFLPVGHNNIDI
jgi:hypothetical protein